MKKNLFLLLLIIGVSIKGKSQEVNKMTNYLKISAGRVLFGTGDIPGFSAGFEYSKKVLAPSSRLFNQLQFGGELTFETGVKNPKIVNPTIDEFLNGPFFYHTSNTTLTIKLTYFPFRKVITGLNVTVGPSIGYSYQSREESAKRAIYSPEESRRESQLEFINTLLLGYRISAGYELNIRKNWLAGIRADFASYTNGDINTLLGLKAGFRF